MDKTSSSEAWTPDALKDQGLKQSDVKNIMQKCEKKTCFTVQSSWDYGVHCSHSNCVM